jgi:N-methylhydantoinase A
MNSEKIAVDGLDSGLLIATDVGGTCTDTVIVKGGKSIFIGKALSTPPRFAQGILDSIDVAAKSMGMSVGEVLAETRLLVHGSTVVDNTLVEHKGSRTGLLTTEGFEDVLLVTRGAYGRWSGLPEDELKHPVHTERPPAIVPFERTIGIPERVDFSGEVLLGLDEKTARAAIEKLVREHKVEALAICLLWGFKNPAHEQRLRELAAEIAPDLYVSLGSDVAPLPGEYERVSTTVINAYAGRVVRDYISNLQSQLRENGYSGPVLVMQGYGGLLPAEEAADFSVGMVECGPVAGVIGSRALGQLMADENIIAADMGGTTFKVGVIQDGQLGYAREPMIDRYHYIVPKIDVASIGSGGGSIISLEPVTGAPLVGPQSAGADPGPICYDRGGDQPTLTDVFLLIGYMSPERFLHGSMILNAEKARRLFEEQIARPLGMSVEEAAVGIYRVAASQAADLIHKITVEQGLDPRDFTLHAFGGSCPILASVLAQELNVRRVVIPYAAPVNCAFGLASADVVHEFTHVETFTTGVSPDTLNARFRELETLANNALSSEGFADSAISLDWSLDMRYSLQVHELTTPLRRIPMTSDGIEEVIRDFEAQYEGRYGKGSGYRDAGIEITKLHLTARGLIPKPGFAEVAAAGEDPSAAKIGEREVFQYNSGKFGTATIYDYDGIRPGNTVTGPAIIHTPITTIVIQDGQAGKMDRLRNIVIDIMDAT